MEEDDVTEYNPAFPAVTLAVTCFVLLSGCVLFGGVGCYCAYDSNDNRLLPSTKGTMCLFTVL